MPTRLPLSIFDAASTEADRLNTLTGYFIVASSAVLLLVIGLLIYIAVKFRGKSVDTEPTQTSSESTLHATAPAETKSLEGNHLEIVMIGVPFVLVAVFFYLAVDTMRAVLPPATTRRPDVVLVGHQFWWEAQYPGASSVDSTVTTANEIHLPAGKPLLLEMRAADVIHDWWVPAFGPKMDMIPGRTNHLWVTIKKPGVYEGVCSEFCGAQHAWMRIRVVAHDPGGYRQWLRDKQRNAQTPTDPNALAGAALFGRSTCGNCHRVGGTKANGNVGPDLTHFASRSTMLAGMLPNNRANLRRWLYDPQAVKPGALMPRYTFRSDSLNMLVSYIASLN